MFTCPQCTQLRTADCCQCGGSRQVTWRQVEQCLVALAIPMFRRAGRPDLASDLAAVLSKVNARYERIIARADAALNGDD